MGYRISPHTQIVNEDGTITIAEQGAENTISVNLGNDNTWSATQTLQTDGSTVPLVVKAAPGQQADLQQWQDASGNVVNRVDSSGQLVTPGVAGSGVNSVANSDGSLVVSPKTGNVVVNLNPGAANIWTGTQTFQTPCVLALSDGEPTGPAVEGTCAVDPVGKKMWVYLSGDWRENSFFGEPSLCQGRLTLVSGVPVPTSDVVGASTLFFTPFDGNRISLYDGKGWHTYQFTETSMNLTGLTPGLPCDVFGYFSNGLSLVLNEWTDPNTRAGNLTLQDGIYVMQDDPTRCFLGTICPTSATTTEDSDVRRFVANYFNRRDRRLRVTDDPSHSYNSPVWRPYNNNLANRVEFVVSVEEDAIQGSMFCELNAQAYVGVNVDATDGSGIFVRCAGNANNQPVWTGSSVVYFPSAPGYHFWQAMEYTGSGPASTYTGMVLNAIKKG